MPSFEQSSVISCVADEHLAIPRVEYPWINAEQATIPSFLVTLNDDTSFRFGSIIGLNNTTEKIASTVSPQDSASTQNVLFMSLPAILKGCPAPGIRKVDNGDLPSSTLFIASRNLVRSAGLIFAVEFAADQTQTSTVLRVGIGDTRQRSKTFAALGIKQVGSRRTRA